jgi:hypothetical protein
MAENYHATIAALRGENPKVMARMRAAITGELVRVMADAYADNDRR